MAKCEVCGKTTDLRCRCKTVYYCSPGCQRAAWPSHKSRCTDTGATPAPPTTGSRTDTISEALRFLEQVKASVLSSGFDHAGRGAAQPPHRPGQALEALTDRDTFLAYVYPGVNESSLGGSMPRSLQQLFEDSRYAEALQAAARRSLQKADQIISSVKAKAAAEGEVMPAETELALRPHAFAEALSREIASVVHSVSDQAVRVAADDDAGLASPMHVLARGHYVPPSALAGLANDAIGWGTAKPFFRGVPAGTEANDDGSDVATDGVAAGHAGGDDDAVGSAWAELVREDCARLAEEAAAPALARWSAPTRAQATCHCITPATDSGGRTLACTLAVTSRYAWIDPGSAMEAEYPALQEALTRLHAIPYELNRAVRPMRLGAPRPGLTALRHLRAVFTVTDHSDSEAARATAAETAAASDDRSLTCYPAGNAFVHDGTSMHGAASSPYKLSCVYAVGTHPEAERMWVRSSLDLQVDDRSQHVVGLSTGNRLVLYRSRSVSNRFKVWVSDIDKAVATVETKPRRQIEANVFVLCFFVLGSEDAFH